MIEHDLKSLLGFSQTIHSLAINRTKQYMLDRIEPDGTLCSYFSSTFLMIFALLSLGHSTSDPLILQAVKGLKAMKCTIHGHTHMQFTTATVWNTSLISYTLQKAGVPSTDSVTLSYRVGQAMGGGFYIHYHSYQYIFPLLALAHYKSKFQGKL